MAGSQISTSVTIINSLLGFQAISLTNMDSAAEPSIAAGSKVEIASAFFTFSSDESATGLSSCTTGATAYLTLTPSGTAGSQVLSAAWTNDEPVWSDSKQGWYASAASTVRYVAGLHKDNPASNDRKFILEPSAQASAEVLMYYDTTMTTFSTIRCADAVYEIGEWDMQNDATKQILLGSTGHFQWDESPCIVSIDAIVRTDSAVTTLWYKLSTEGLVVIGQSAVSGNLISLSRETGGTFDSSDFNATASTVANRGYVIVKYVL